MTTQDRRDVCSKVGLGTYLVVITGRNFLLRSHHNTFFSLVGQRTKLLDVTEGVCKSYYVSAEPECMPFQFSVGRCSTSCTVLFQCILIIKEVLRCSHSSNY